MNLLNGYRDSSVHSNIVWFHTLKKLIYYLLIVQTVLASEAEERLVRDIFRDYNKLIRPVELINETVSVELKVYLIQLINVNEKNQVMTSNVWLEMNWYDYQLKWDATDYDGIQILRLPADKVWKPDIVLFNNADGNYEVRYQSNVLIDPSGNVQWVPPTIFQSSCRIDVTYFPFDQQTCEMKFSSWTYNGDQVKLILSANKSRVLLSDYVKSGTWNLVDVPGFVNDKPATATEPRDIDITFHITIRRKPLFYTVNLILPAVLISFLCILVFYLPAEAGEKITLGISVLLALVVFLLLVSKILPPTSLVLPLIAKYLLFTFIMNCFSILMTVIIINWNTRGPRTHHMPNWVRVVFLKYLPMLLFMKRPKRTRLRWMMEMPSLGVHFHPRNANNRSSPNGKGQNFCSNKSDPGACGDGGGGSVGGVVGGGGKLMMDSVELSHIVDSRNRVDLGMVGGCGSDFDPEHTDDLVRDPSAAYYHYGQSNMAHTSGFHHPHCASNFRSFQPSSANIGPEADGIDLLCLTPEAYKATEAIEFIAEHLRSEDEYIQIREDWKYVAMVIDRLQLYIFFLATLFGSLFILLDAPHIFEHVDQDALIKKDKV
ncbi:nicotinic acetylcholine receptor beta1 [Brevipalpus obovatus]|uniref:nicotinic acetylcholine receptor beta1 n=1 Tax=Brevipalpus obovatus TaxID=246614 RepID=UPI003D9F5416